MGSNRKQQPASETASQSQQRMLGYAALVSLIIAILFFAPFFGVIVTALILAYSFLPLHNWFVKKLKRPAIAPALTLLCATLLLIVPIILVGMLTFTQAQQLYQDIQNDETLLSAGYQAVQNTESALQDLTGSNLTINVEAIADSISGSTAAIANSLVRGLGSAVTNIPLLFSSVILFLYLFLATLRYNQQIVGFLRRTNPLDEELFTTALKKVGAMTDGMVRGQFVIALVQGGIGALSYAVIGLPLIAFFFVVLSFLSLIPLGSGIVSFPVGIILLLTGNIWQGLFVLIIHVIVVSNIDNVLRPALIPKEARLPSALTLLGVFAGLATFGFLGLFVGPILLILILTILDTYGKLNVAEKDYRKAPQQTPSNNPQ